MTMVRRRCLLALLEAREFPHGTPVLQAARTQGGLGFGMRRQRNCARCQVIHTTGEFPKHGLVSAASHLSPFDATEEKLVAKQHD